MMKRHRMKTPTRILALASRAAIGAACLLVVAGCRQQVSPGDEHDQDENHAGHVIPAHKPRTFPAAVSRLRDLNDQIGRARVKDPPGTPLDEKTLQMALDIANWLPEIAADSDMPEKPWNEVNAQAAALVIDYETLRNGSASARPSDASRAVSDADATISALQKILAEANPQWFDSGKKKEEEKAALWGEPEPGFSAVGFQQIFARYRLG